MAASKRYRVFTFVVTLLNLVVAVIMIVIYKMILKMGIKETSIWKNMFLLYLLRLLSFDFGTFFLRAYMSHFEGLN